MDKTFLEKRIEKRAIKRFDEEYKQFITLLRKNNIADEIKININGDLIPLVNFGSNYGVFNNEELNTERTKKHTNLEYVKKTLIDRYIQEETDNVLSELHNIKQLFDWR